MFLFSLYALAFGEMIGSLGSITGDVYNQSEVMDQKRFFYAMMFLAIAAGTGLGAFLQTCAFSVAGERLAFRLTTLSYRAILRKEIAWFDKRENSVGYLCQQLSSDAQAAVQGATGARIGLIFQVFISIVTAVSLSLFFSWKLALANAAFIPVVMLSAIALNRLLQVKNDSLSSSMAQVASEAISSIRTVASLGKEDAFWNNYSTKCRTLFLGAECDNKRHNLVCKNWSTSILRGLFIGLSSNATPLASIVCLAYGAYLIHSEGLQCKSIYIICEALIFGMDAIGLAMAFAPDFEGAKRAASRITSLLNENVPSKNVLRPTAVDLQIKGKIEFEGVTFSYPNRPDVDVLCDFSAVMLHPNKTVALVGPSGCGKSTCLQLILQFYNAKSGVIRMDDQHLLNSALTEVMRQNLAIVSQEPVLFDRTVAENIAYGSNSATMAQIVEAARTANIHEFIQSLPMGYETNVGPKGGQLSGGQKQRIAIARAIIRDPKILLLDEATSALDAESEMIVQEALTAASRGRTCLLIAHRLSAIQHVDLILVVNKGRVHEQGKHQDLIRLKGIYYQMWTAQQLPEHFN